MKTQVVVLAENDNKNRNCEAVVIGPLAVVRCYRTGVCGDDWQVSHIPTGYRVKGCIKSRARALRVAKALQFLDWNFRSPNSRKVKAMAEKVEWAINCTV